MLDPGAPLAAPPRKRTKRIRILAGSAAAVVLLAIGVAIGHVITKPQGTKDATPATFTPPPKVVSSVIRMKPRVMGPHEPSFATMERVVAAAFAQRRKMLRAGLRAFTPEPIVLLEAAGIDPTARAEELDIDAFRRLAVLWEATTK